MNSEQTKLDLMELFRTRRSYRRFDQSRAVPGDVLLDMERALRLSSSAGNLQPLRYVLVTDPALADAVFPLTRWAALLPKEQGTPKEGERPTAYLAILFDGTGNNAWTGVDAGIAMSNVTLAAWAHGVGSCILGNIDRDALGKLLGVPDAMQIHSLIAFGYPTHRSTVVSPGPDGSLRYYLDGEGNYLVPKREADQFLFINRYGASPSGGAL